ncbi:MAG: AAA family ATPase [Cyanobacteria bacterium P01_B01_bin.77]
MEFELSLNDVPFEDILDYVNGCVQDYAGSLLTDVETDILRLTWEENLSYDAMAKRMDYAQSTLRGVYGYELWKLLDSVWLGEEKVKKSSFNRVVKRRYQDWLKSQHNGRSAPTDLPTNEQPSHLLERNTLASRLLESLNSGYRSIILTGSAGIGKTHLLRSLQSELGDHFTHIVYHPIHELPSWQAWHRMLVSSSQNFNRTALAEHQLRQQVVQTLNQTPYLIVVDQSERFLNESQYNSFFNEISAAVTQQSCLLWSSDMAPIGLDRHIIAVETIEGLPFTEAKKLLIEHYPHFESSISQNEEYWQQINDLCGGHPALLHRVVDTIQSFYDNQIEQFISNLLPLSPSLSRYFDELFGKLSDPEKALLYWLALRPLSWLDLKQWLPFVPFGERQLMEAWDTLQRRHLIQSASEGEGARQITPRYFGLYVISKLQDFFAQELLEDNLNLFHSYPVIFPQASFQQQQILRNYLLRPLAATLRKQSLQKDLSAKFSHLFSLLAAFNHPSHSFAAGNLFNLATDMGLSIANVDWRNLTLRHADLTVPGLKDIDFQNCQFRDAVVPTGLQGRLVTALHPTGHTMAVGDEQGLVQVYTWAGHRFSLDWCYDLGLPVQEIIITAGDKLIVATVEQIQIWDAIANKDNVYSVHLETVTLDSLAVSPKDRLLAAGLSDGTIQLWNLTWGEKEGEPLLGANYSVKHVTFSPDGRSIAAYDNNNQILLWHQDPSTGDYRAAVTPLPIDPYGNFLTFKWIDTQLSVVEAVPQRSPREHLFGVVIRSFAIAEEMLSDDSIQLDVQKLPHDFEQPHHAIFSADGSYLILCDIEHTLTVWHYNQPIPTRSIQLPAPPCALKICNGGRILLCQDDHRLGLWNLTQQQCFQVWDSVSDLDQYHNCKFYEEQGLSSDELMTVQRLGAILG